MNSPESLRQRLKKQWQKSDYRIKRFQPNLEALKNDSSMPFSLSIGKPKAKEIKEQIEAVEQHLKQWREVKEGKVIWQEVHYRATDCAVKMPIQWQIETLYDWVNACRDKQITREFDLLKTLLAQAPIELHQVLLSKKKLWSHLSTKEAIQVLEVVKHLHPNACQGLPLRAYSVCGSDTKFFERYKQLITLLLDARYAGAVSKQGLSDFLGAMTEKGHWILLYDLDGSLLPFELMRVRSSELTASFCSASHCLIVENEQCFAVLPRLKNTLAILGTGFDLTWLAANWLRKINLIYWGDLDTWGLKMLSDARKYAPHLQAVLMQKNVFDQHSNKEVTETIKADLNEDHSLTKEELELFLYLHQREKGRLEQEFITPSLVKKELLKIIENGN